MTSNQYSSATNLSGPDLSTASALNNAQRYFSNFPAKDFSVGPANDVIVAFFETYTSNQVTAKNLASAVLYTAQVQNLNPIAVLEDFQRLPKGQLDSYLVAFLNLTRAPTSSLGIKTKVQTNDYVQRAVIL